MSRLRIVRTQLAQDLTRQHMNPFDPTQYWEARLADNFDLRGVGQRNCGIYFNRWAYRVRRSVFLRQVRSLGIDFGLADCLDIGAGTGFYIDRWKELGVQSITGVDLTNVVVERLQQRYPESAFYKMDIGKDLGALDAKRFDAVSCMDVLFHIVDDHGYQKAFDNVCRLLKPGGYFVFSEAFVRRGSSRAEHVVHRGLDHIEAVTHRAGLRIIGRRPLFVLMNDPVGAGQRWLHAYWHALHSVIKRVHRFGTVAGAVLYPLELVLVTVLKQGPSTQIMLCQRPEGGAE